MSGVRFKMVRFHRYLQHALLLTLIWTTVVTAMNEPSRRDKLKRRRCNSSRDHHHMHSDTMEQDHVLDGDHIQFQHIRQDVHTSPHRSAGTSSSSTSSVSVEKRGMRGRAGDIEWMGYFGSLISIPTMLSVLGIVTNYNLERSYFNSQINAQYYKQTREMLRAHAAKLIREQEMKFAKSGQTWNGMIYDQDGNVNAGAKMPTWNGNVVAMPPTAEEQSAVTVGGAGGAGGTGSGGSPGQQQAQLPEVGDGQYGNGLAHDDDVGS